MSDSSTRLLELPARRTARLLAIRQLDEWVRVRARLNESSDSEDLHQFRVALRRLRSLIRAYRSPSDEIVPPRLRRRLRRFAEATGDSRDLDVQCAWVTDQLPNLTLRQDAGARWMLSRLESRRGPARERVLHRLAKRFDRLEESLRSALAKGESMEGQPVALLAGEQVSDIVQRWTLSMESELGAIETIADDAHAHAARIAAKRLRYVLEPLEDELPSASPVIHRLKELQTLLGDFHDSHRLASALLQEYQAAAAIHAEWTFHDILPWAITKSETTTARHRDPRPGLIALTRRLKAKGEELFSNLKNDWLEGGAARQLCGDLRAELRENGGTGERGTGNGESESISVVQE